MARGIRNLFKHAKNFFNGKVKPALPVVQDTIEGAVDAAAKTGLPQAVIAKEAIDRAKDVHKSVKDSLRKK